jgi:chromatin segregation and condensation protein Rec8/ScpA/Scc1 (kleisin family)
MAFEVATPVYDGPFDLLLHLILKEEVDIYEVSLTRIVEAYLEEIQRMQMLDLSPTNRTGHQLHPILQKNWEFFDLKVVKT